jgi:hypothetical protein
MKRAVAWGLVLFVVGVLFGRAAEVLGVARCRCADDCWCRRRGLSLFCWVAPYGHRLAAEAVVEMTSAAPVPSDHGAAVAAPRYWLFKRKDDDGTDVFSCSGAVEWCGHHSTRSAEVMRTLNDEVSVGDVVAAYRTDLKSVIGYLRVVRLEGPRDARTMFVGPIHRLDPAFRIHDHKAGTSLADSAAVRGSVMLRELSAAQMCDLVRLSGAPDSVLHGE